MDTETVKGRGGAGRGQGRKAGPVESRALRRSVYLSDVEWDHCNREWMQGVGASEYVRRLVQADIARRKEPVLSEE